MDFLDKMVQSDSQDPREIKACREIRDRSGSKDSKEIRVYKEFRDW
jgi:hypothetical protein